MLPVVSVIGTEGFGDEFISVGEEVVPLLTDVEDELSVSSGRFVVPVVVDGAAEVGADVVSDVVLSTTGLRGLVHAPMAIVATAPRAKRRTLLSIFIVMISF